MAFQNRPRVLSPYPFIIEDGNGAPPPSPNAPAVAAGDGPLEDGSLIELMPIAVAPSPQVAAGEPQRPAPIRTLASRISAYGTVLDRSFGGLGTTPNVSRSASASGEQHESARMLIGRSANQGGGSAGGPNPAIPLADDFVNIQTPSGGDENAPRTADIAEGIIGPYERLSLAPLLRPLRVGGEGGRPWLAFEIWDSNGGEVTDEYRMSHVLNDDANTYCSRLKRNVNIIMTHKSALSEMRAAPFSLEEVCIRVPPSGFTSPLKNGFLFVCTEPLELSAFDHYDCIETTRLLEPDGTGSARALPMVPSCVKTVLYFQLDRSATTFNYKFQTPIPNSHYIFAKLLGSFGSRDNIDVQFIGFKGSTGRLCFPNAGLM